MFRKGFVLLLALVFFTGVSFVLSGAASYAQENPAAQSAETVVVAEKAVDAGNKICPVSGEKIGEKTKATFEYEGKVYNFCCPDCIAVFKKDPQKYIQKVEEELKAQAPEEEQAPMPPQEDEGARSHMH